MKRFLAIIASLMLVLGFAASAFAIHAEIPSETQAVVAKGSTQLTLGGEIRMRGWYFDNVNTTGAGYFTDYTPQNVASNSYYDARVRLSLKADVSKNTTGFVHLESGANAAGVSTSDTYAWGTLNQKPGVDMQILEAWILHKGSGLLGIPAGIKVGHMPLMLGEGQFLDLRKFGSDAIVFFMDPTKELHIGLLTAKVGNADANATNRGDDDIDTYVALMTYKVDPKNTIGVNYTLINSANVMGATPANALNFSNLGLHANGDISGLMYKAEVDFQWGKIEGVMPGPSDLKQRGLGIFAELGYKIDPVTIKARYGYGSGDSEPTDATDGKNKEFQTILGRDVHHTFIYEYMLDGAASNQWFAPGSTTQYRARGLANTTMFSLGLSFAPVKDLSVALDYFLLRANKFASTDNIDKDTGAARANRTGTSKNIGNELDLRVTYKIDRNLTYSILAGYFWSGGYYEDAYDYTAATQKKNVPAMVHAITLSF